MDAKNSVDKVNSPVISRQKRKRETTHRSIMHSAKKLYEEKGIGNITIEEITEAADVSRSTFFSHFVSLEALSTEIAGVAIEDILATQAKSGARGLKGLKVLSDKLVDDTCPYPYLTSELLMNGIVKSRGKSPFFHFEKLIRDELVEAKVTESNFTVDEQVGLIMGAYFGLVFQKLIKAESFSQPDKIKNTINKLINMLTGGNL